MPKEPSKRLKLENPSTGEFDWDKNWWENTDILDKYPGIKVVISSTLPEEPWVASLSLMLIHIACWSGMAITG